MELGGEGYGTADDEMVTALNDLMGDRRGEMYGRLLA